MRSGAEDIELESEGVGVVHAFFTGLLKHYCAPYPSLKSINFADFRIEGELSTSETSIGVTEAAPRFCSSEHPRMSSSSFVTLLLQSPVPLWLGDPCSRVFINSERAFVQLHNALAHARSEHRQDSVQRYTEQLTRLVEATSYSDVIAKLKEDL